MEDLKQNLRARIARGIVAFGIGLGSLVGGCEEEMTEADWIGLGLQGYATNAETPKQTQSAYALSDFARTAGRRHHEKNLARESRSNVNVSYGGGDGSVSSPLERKKVPENKIFYTCIEEAEDKYGRIKFHPKKIFYSGEKIFMHGHVREYFPNLAPGTKLANMNVHLKTGQSDFYDKKLPVTKELMVDRVSFDASHLANKIGEGEYENIWYAQVDGKWQELGRVRYAVFKLNFRTFGKPLSG